MFLKLSDDFPQFLIVENLKKLRLSRWATTNDYNVKNVSCYENDYSHFNETSFLNDFCSVDWSFMNSPDVDTNFKFDTF